MPIEFSKLFPYFLTSHIRYTDSRTKYRFQLFMHYCLTTALAFVPSPNVTDAFEQLRENGVFPPESQEVVDTLKISGLDVQSEDNFVVP
ncbi:hypothetical protein NPIL_506461 [Nephila pilipes]|uniref:Uncharacterized protein n=1 Tax=Nephila pilipes TaxID=299642 RepID=A0A8X6Q6H4_NEPPI|nr:hypothetical protein NPIL_506461 [Nephila pilipes]